MVLLTYWLLPLPDAPTIFLQFCERSGVEKGSHYARGSGRNKIRGRTNSAILPETGLDSDGFCGRDEMVASSDGFDYCFKRKCPRRHSGNIITFGPRERTTNTSLTPNTRELVSSGAPQAIDAAGTFKRRPRQIRRTSEPGGGDDLKLARGERRRQHRSLHQGLEGVPGLRRAQGKMSPNPQTKGLRLNNQ